MDRRTRLILAGVLAAPLLATAAPAHAAPAKATDGLDGPGNYVVVRTYPQTAGPTAEQNAACDRHFGSPRSLTVALRQNAVGFTPLIDRTTGRAVDEAAEYSGAGYICAAPALNQDLTEAFAIADVPAGRATMHGPCQASLPGWVRLAAFVGCRLTVDPLPGVSQGGHAVSNTVAGSIFVAHLVRDPAEPLPHTPPGPAPAWQTLPNDPDFYLWRDFASTVSGTSADCQRAGALGTTGVRTASLSATQPDPQTAVLDPAEQLTRVGKVTLCFTRAGSTFALAEIQRSGTTVHVTAIGDCRTAPTLAGRDLRMQTCTLGVLWADSPQFRAGQLTAIGLVRADDYRVAANSHIWTLGILDGKTEPVS